MAEDSVARVSSDGSSDASQNRQRKKRKWDQPAEVLVAAGVPLQSVNLGNGVGVPLPGVAPVSGANLTNSLAAASANIPSVFQQQATAVASKLNLPKIQEELIIAREIVINDAESSIRYKLTKRQTQEEIQRCTGAVVITRGKYRPPNAPPDGGKPLYLHISAASHLKETAERILAVDRAASIVEEMLKHGQNAQFGSSSISMASNNGVKALSTCVYLGFDVDPSWDIASCICGPNDQYINHIMNETGAAVLLRGCGSGNSESPNIEEIQQPLHLLLSSSNPKNLEDAKRLAEHLLDTISLEFGKSRFSSGKVYGAVPPPQQLLCGIQSSGNEQKVNTGSEAVLASSDVTSSAPALAVPAYTGTCSQGTVLPSLGVLNHEQPHVSLVSYTPPSVTVGTSYSGYGGIYPQATPLQQLALVLRQSAPINSTIAPTTSTASTVAPPSVSNVANANTDSNMDSEKKTRPPQKRKFQELPAGAKGPSKQDQEQDILEPSEHAANSAMKNVSMMHSSKKLVHTLSNGMPPPPPRMMPAPPPPPKFNAATPAVKSADGNDLSDSGKGNSVPDTLVKLMEYGEDDDDADFKETVDDSFGRRLNANVVHKPFWAL